MDSVILQDQNSTHYDNGDGTATVVISDNLNYRSRGEWLEVDTYYLESIGDDAWSNYADDYPVTLVGGVVSTPDGWWQVEGVYLGDTKLWEPDFTNYGKVGDTVSYLTPWGVLRYTIRPDSYREEFVFDENPVAGLLVDGDALTVRYIGGIDSVVWSKDALDRSYPIDATTTEKSISREDLYRAKYPLVLDPTDSFGASGDAYVERIDGVLSPLSSSVDRLVFGNSKWYDTKSNVTTYYNYRSLLRFDLSSIAGATVSTTTFGVNNGGWGVPVASAPVVGSTATTDPRAMNPTTLWNAVAGTSLGTISLPGGVNKWGTLTGEALRNFVGGKVGGFCSIGITDGGTGQCMAASSLYSTSSLRPYLTVTYTTGTTYTLTYDANGGANQPSAQTGGTTYTVSGIGSMTREGYNFVAWNTAANGSGTSYAPSASITLSANTTLYAQWKIKDSDALFFGAGL